MIAMDPLAGDPCLHQQDAERPILAEDRARQGDNNVDDPDRVLP